MEKLPFGFAKDRVGKNVFQIHFLLEVTPELKSEIAKTQGIEQVFESGRYFLSVRKGEMFDYETVITNLTKAIEDVIQENAHTNE